jgi:peptidoglycan/LPS O-acetylase OafA/YrhL
MSQHQTYALLDQDPNTSRTSSETLQGLEDANDIVLSEKASRLHHCTRYLLISRDLTFSCLLGIIPSFLRPRPTSHPPKRLHHTAYLDGVRGVAAVAVVSYHMLVDRWADYESGYVVSSPTHSMLQLPFLRLVASGRGMVTTFFVLSGFVLSYKPLRCARAGDLHGLLETLASSVFRRPFRLYLATAPSMLIAMFMLRAGIAHWLDWDKKVTFLEQVEDWLEDFFTMANPFRGVDSCGRWGPAYNGPLWTMPLEFRGSMVVFVVVLGLSRLRPRARMLGVLGLALFCLYKLSWDVYLFLVGVLIAEIDILREAERVDAEGLEQDCQEKHIVSTRSRLRRLGLSIVQTFLFLACMHVLTFPTIWHETLGFETLGSMMPAFISESGCMDIVQFTWLSIGASCIILLLVSSPMLQRPFTTAFAQYLGRVSFSLYMVHAFVVFTVSWWARDRVWEAWGLVGHGHWITYLIAWILAFWAADIYCRVFDENAVVVGKWVYDKLSVEMMSI